MGLLDTPATGNTAYGPGSQVKSVDLDALQDAVVGIRNGTLGVAQPLRHLWLPAAAGQVVSGTGSYASNVWASTVAGGAYTVAVPLTGLKVGDRITSVTVYGREGGAGETYSAVLRRIFPTTGDTIGGTKTSGTTNANSSVAWTTADTDFTPSGHVVGSAGYEVDVTVNSSSSSGEVQFRAIDVAFDRP